MDEIRWGIIGCGDVTEVKSGPAFDKVHNSSLVAVMRRNGEKAKDYAERHDVPKWYDKAEDLIHDPEVNAVYIATPPANHRDYTIEAAKVGKPVYVEKPMARNAEECSEMITYCKEKQVPLYVAFYRRALPRFLKVKELLDKGEIGDIRFVTSRHTKPLMEKDENGEWPWRVQPEISGGGLFYDLASHTLDLLDFLISPIEEVKGFAANQASAYPAEDMVSGNFRFKNGVIGNGVWSFSSYKDEDINRIVGTKGEITFSTFDHTPITLLNDNGVQEFNIEHPKHIQQGLIQKIVDELLGKDTSPSTGESAQRTNWVMDEMVREYYEKG
ncbi:gfo/Idh/MocA family oxidoreductase [Pontibacillus yanchengensis]|uniref:Gfo/Idh/MocA family oxidoreductase n=2 Tax=Pontibacillus yanchengensis TaxID=462910 RepID=A0ACC7VF96_9BACI|nr:Gfo/Idh/MocA family oxidoreductase [Pontibacillus yanchengensis]MYL32022.1 gfo/Idh/MocA family oxidoreductase [Pontibacillus yanchengensis]MYL52599.1 gfo/Idh/MocA family oxidoreductase [Pontibacillus yanchengensis]